MDGAGNELILAFVISDVAEHPFTSVPVTVYAPGVVMLMDWVVSPVFHKYEVAPLAVKVFPEHIATLPEGEMDTEGNGFIVSTNGEEDAVQPFTPITVTE